MGFLSVCDRYGTENLVKLGFCTYSDLRRKLADVKAAGVLYQTDRPESLAPLTALSSRDISKDSEAANVITYPELAQLALPSIS